MGLNTMTTNNNKTSEDLIINAAAHLFDHGYGTRIPVMLNEISCNNCDDVVELSTIIARYVHMDY